MDSFTRDETVSSQVFYILLALTDKTLHGYGIRDQVAHDSEGAVVMAQGAVYVILKRMVLRGLVRKVVSNDDRPKIKNRYEITEKGKQVLKNEMKRMRQAAEHARYKLTGQIHF